MENLKWEKKSNGKWLLKSSDGQIWAAVYPYRSEYACKNQFKGLALHANCAHGKCAGRYWTTGIGVSAAKKNIVGWLSRQSYDSFDLVAA